MKQALRAGVAAAIVLIAGSGAAFAQAKTLEQIKTRGILNCGVNAGLAGFGQPDDKGEWSGLNADFCRAIAAAIFGDAKKVSFKGLNARDRLISLQTGEVDVLSHSTTWTLSRDSSLGLSFAGAYFYDGQGFMVKKSLGVKSAKELKGASICVQTGSTTELNLADYFRTHKIDYKPVVFEKNDEVVAAYTANRCDVMTTDVSALFAERLRLVNPDDNVVLPEIVSKEPLGPAVRQGDSQWFTVVRWVHNAMLNAEELGVTRGNVDDMLKSANPDIKRLLGTEGEFGKGIGLDNDWVVKIVKAVGNYGESYERNVGSGSRLKIARGQNALWNAGGLQYAPPIR
jgi:general L-amino acid transport system substrate-binding protein